MAEIAVGRGRLALQPRRAKGRPREEGRGQGAAAVRGAAARDPGRRSADRQRLDPRNKYDGYRLLIAVGDGVATAWTRNGKDWSDKFKALVKAAAKLPAGCLIDGEAVALDDQGRPSFQLLQSTLKDRRREPRLLRLRPAGRPRRGHPQAPQPRAQGAARGAARRRRAADPLWRSCRRPRRSPVRRRSASRAAKGSSRRRPSAPYRGTRTRDWLKIKCIQRQEFVIVGWSESDKRRGFRSLLLRRRRAASCAMPARSGPASTPG